MTNSHVPIPHDSFEANLSSLQAKANKTVSFVNPIGVAYGINDVSITRVILHQAVISYYDPDLPTCSITQLSF